MPYDPVFVHACSGLECLSYWPFKTHLRVYFLLSHRDQSRIQDPLPQLWIILQGR